ncbi:MAG: hypothetical protein OEZ58_21425 [Gammaproteobacteria bacterium]|nr:hypothetical protein [Gammaproteobacteria bacterium]MDH5731554.1 hypothetical protein [Gammaproteobacteria bacterium]
MPQVKAKQMQQGFVAVTSQFGELLKRYFSVSKKDLNELSNHLNEIDIPD